ncbi:hypothetical protein J6590_016568 [Homalodisca vitripennis]|nr:hypothetical protein J6590_016568 [Homalodisca vitripennis]
MFFSRRPQFTHQKSGTATLAFLHGVVCHTSYAPVMPERFSSNLLMALSRNYITRSRDLLVRFFSPSNYGLLDLGSVHSEYPSVTELEQDFEQCDRCHKLDRIFLMGKVDGWGFHLPRSTRKDFGLLSQSCLLRRRGASFEPASPANTGKRRHALMSATAL